VWLPGIPNTDLVRVHYHCRGGGGGGYRHLPSGISVLRQFAPDIPARQHYEAALAELREKLLQLMTENDWLTTRDWHHMLTFLQGKSSERKLRLFACGCIRRRWPNLLGIQLQALEQIEQSLDGEGEMRPGVAWGFTSTWPLHFSDEFMSARVAANGMEASAATALLREIIGNPFRPLAVDPTWKSASVVAIARSIYQERRFPDVLILADALEDAGCASALILEHCRTPGDHVRGCWLLDLLLEKE
jgi:hypothetical protein